MSITNIRY